MGDGDSKRGKGVHGKGEKGQSYLKLVKMFKITCSGLSFSLDEKMPNAQLTNTHIL